VEGSVLREAPRVVLTRAPSAESIDKRGSVICHWKKHRSAGKSAHSRPAQVAALQTVAGAPMAVTEEKFAELHPELLQLTAVEGGRCVHEVVHRLPEELPAPQVTRDTGHYHHHHFL